MRYLVKQYKAVILLGCLIAALSQSPTSIEEAEFVSWSEYVLVTILAPFKVSWVGKDNDRYFAVKLLPGKDKNKQKDLTEIYSFIKKTIKDKENSEEKEQELSKRVRSVLRYISSLNQNPFRKRSQRKAKEAPLCLDDLKREGNDNEKTAVAIIILINHQSDRKIGQKQLVELWTQVEQLHPTPALSMKAKWLLADSARHSGCLELEKEICKNIISSYHDRCRYEAYKYAETRLKGKLPKKGMLPLLVVPGISMMSKAK